MQSKQAFVLDVGSASVRLIIGRSNGTGSWDPVFNMGVVSNLRKALNPANQLIPEAAERTLKAVELLKNCAGLSIPDYGACLCTQTVRQAQNSEWFIGRLGEIAGVPPETLSPFREGELAFVGSKELMREGDVLIDMGGGSTELIEPDDSGSVRVLSIPLGAGVSIDEGLVTGERMDATSLTDRARKNWETRLGQDVNGRYRRAVILGGTITTLGAIIAGQQQFNPGALHGIKGSVDELKSITIRLHGMTESERAKIGGMEPGREGIIVNGGFLLAALLDQLGICSFIISERGIRYGRLQELFQADF